MKKADAFRIAAAFAGRALTKQVLREFPVAIGVREAMAMQGRAAANASVCWDEGGHPWRAAVMMKTSAWWAEQWGRDGQEGR